MRNIRNNSPKMQHWLWHLRKLRVVKVCSFFDIVSRLCLTVSEILALRKGMWEKVNRRRHQATKIFPFGPNSDEVMLYGTVEYGLKDGREATVDWAARAHLVKDGGAVMMDFYQVYLVSAMLGPIRSNRLYWSLGRTLLLRTMQSSVYENGNIYQTGITLTQQHCICVGQVLAFLLILSNVLSQFSDLLA